LETLSAMLFRDAFVVGRIKWSDRAIGMLALKCILADGTLYPRLYAVGS
jgi:hypothetical protein